MLYSIVTMFRRRGWFGALCFVLAATLPTYVLGSQVLLSLSSLPAVEAHLFNKPHSIFSRLVSRVHRAISASLPRPPPPPATRTTGGSPSPTRTRITTAHRPAPPEPAYARLSGRSCTFPRSKSSDPPLRHRSPTVFAQGLARCLRILSASVSWLRPARIDASLFFTSFAVEPWSPKLTRFMQLYVIALSLIRIYTLTGKIRWVHYHYDIIFEGDRSSKRILNSKRTWTSECGYPRRERQDWKMWKAVDGDIQIVRRKYGRVRGFSLKVRVIRRRVVRDWYVTIFGARSVEVPEDPYHGTVVFETEDEFMLSAPDLDHDLELPTRERGEFWRDRLFGEPPTPPSSAPPTPSPRQGAFVRPVRIADPDDPPDAGEGQRMLWH
ncbi:hypothetical protein FRC08_003065 [Ceratobasidium sp. 394]|nr:hypothetical protein FRC08_003065 [Ceratobasidium sp. 394]